MMMCRHGRDFRSAVVAYLGLGLTIATIGHTQVPSREMTEGTSRHYTPKDLEGVGVDEHLGAKLPLDLAFLNDSGKMVRLGDLVGNSKPVILSLNYSSCPMLCNVQLTGLAQALQNVPWTAGLEYDVVSVSIDPRETPDKARQAKMKYAELYGKGGSGHGWHFLVGQELAIEQLASAVGVKFHWVETQQEYAHAAVFALISPDGRIMRYIYGVSFEPKTLRLSLVEASEGKIGTTVDRFLLYCFHYDSTVGDYRPFAVNLMKVAAAVTVVVLALVMVGFFWREHRRSQAMSALPAATP
jgi:protein SCO1/2